MSSLNLASRKLDFDKMVQLNLIKTKALDAVLIMFWYSHNERRLLVDSVCEGRHWPVIIEKMPSLADIEEKMYMDSI